MAALRRSLALACLVFASCGTLPITRGAEPDAAPSRPELLTVTGTVLMPDGSPAVGAIVTSRSQADGKWASVLADAAGSFQLRDMFGNGMRLHATTKDGRHQSSYWLAAIATRNALVSPVELKLEPAQSRKVMVVADGKPAEGARVVAGGIDFQFEAATGKDGAAELWFPAGRELRELVAWHPQLGVAGTRVEENRPQIKSAELALHAPAAHEVRVIDTAGNAVGDVELAVSVRMKESGWIISRSIEASHVRAGADGVATLAWVPRDGVLGLDVDLIDSDWKIDEIDRDHLAERQTIVQVRKKVTVEGRLVMPDGAIAAGILISGFGFGPQGRGDVPYARARHDGTFTLPIASDHGYVLGIVDPQWASNPWTGTILKSNGAEASDVEIKIYRATPVNIRVTRGTDRQPVADAWVEVSNQADFQFVDAGGKQRNARAGVRGWLRTDALGVATAGVGLGEQGIRLADGTWTEERTVNVKSTDSLDIDFHRDWLGNRRLVGRLTADGQAYVPSPGLVVYAWTERSPTVPLSWQPEVKPDGTIQVSFDAENMAILVVDREREKSAYATIGANESTAQLEMQNTARYSGTLLDEKGVPMGGRVIKLSADKAYEVVVGMQPTDEKGQFQFAGVAVGVPLSLSIESDEPSSWYSLSSRQRLFQPGEIRENDVVKAQLHHERDSDDAPKVVVPLKETIARVCRNARVARMRGLAVLEGDDSGNVNRLADNLLGSEDSREILNFVTVRISAEQLKSEVGALTDLGWQLPAAKEVVLVVLDGEQKPIASERLAADGGDIALDQGRNFLKEHKLPTRDAVSVVKAARTEAQATGRRVWLVEGGPRCGPCFRLAGWMDDHHDTLEKDYVLVKVMGGLDDNVDAALAELPRKKSGIPWHAITEPDGTVLMTSEGPLGNIGMPSSIEGVRHLRQMLDRTVRKLSADELDRMTKPMIKSD